MCFLGSISFFFPELQLSTKDIYYLCTSSACWLTQIVMALKTDTYDQSSLFWLLCPPPPVPCSQFCNLQTSSQWQHPALMWSPCALPWQLPTHKLMGKPAGKKVSSCSGKPILTYWCSIRSPGHPVFMWHHAIHFPCLPVLVQCHTSWPPQSCTAWSQLPS